jgi:YidC/Oxa1 family membrane protein insertase
MDEQQRNLIIAVALSIAILLGFQFFFGQQQHPPALPASTQTSEQQQAPTDLNAAAPAAPAGVAPVRPRDEVLTETPRVGIETPRLKGSINLVGAGIDDLTLLTYHQTTDPESPPIRLLSPEGSEHPYAADFGWAPSQGIKLPDATTRWTASSTILTPDRPVELTWDNGAGLRFIRRFAVDQDYMFTITETVENHGESPVTLYPYGRVDRTGNPVTSSTYILHEGPIGVFNGTLNDGIAYKDLKPGDARGFSTTGGWMGFTDKYWLVSLVPDQQEPVKVRFLRADHDSSEIFQSDYTGSEHVVPPQGGLSITDRLFAGAKELRLLDNYETTLHIPLFDHAIDFGWFDFLTKRIFQALDYFNRVLGNFGLAILLLTVIIKLLFFPLANKSYRAMSKMKLLQPEMAKLKERYGEDKERLNQETMALYKRVGANPVAGCLPIVIQIPVFFALYKVLYVTIEMRGAPFYGWIHDLSVPDPTSFVNLFGLLPYTVPHIPALASVLNIGLWPMIMGVTMFLQQKLNPPPADPVSAKMFTFLPLFFTWMLAQFPAGLVIYWTWNNLLSIAQQWVIMRRAGVKHPTR